MPAIPSRSSFRSGGIANPRPRAVLGGAALGIAVAATVSHNRHVHTRASCASDAACRVGPAMRGCLNAPRRRIDPTKAEGCIVYGQVQLTDREKKIMACPWVRLRQGVSVGACARPKA